MHARLLLCLPACWLAAVAARAQPSLTREAVEEQPVRIRMSVDPAPEPRPALRYHLRHEVIDQISGNAALGYQMALIQFRDAQEDPQAMEKVQEWLDLPLGDMPLEEVRALVDRFGAALDTLSRAARHEQCDWQLPVREEGVQLLLPHLTQVRSLARLQSLRARLRLAGGAYDEALADLRTGLTLARHVGNGVTLIEGLVGIAIAAKLLDRVEEWAAAPGAPNLYWALTDMASPPLFSFHRALQWEKSLLYVHAPALQEINRRPITPEEFHRLLGEVRAVTELNSRAMSTEQMELQRLAGTGMALAVYPRACTALSARGYTPEEIAAMPVTQIVTRYFLDHFEETRDDMMKWSAVPFPQAREGMRMAGERLEAAQREDPLGNFLPSLLLPAISHAYVRFADLDRRVAALRCVEALRMHAAGSGGQFPDRLDQVQAAPVPEDPLTGRPFTYAGGGTTARLELPAVGGDNPKHGRIYDITVRD